MLREGGWMRTEDTAKSILPARLVGAGGQVQAELIEYKGVCVRGGGGRGEGSRSSKPCIRMHTCTHARRSPVQGTAAELAADGVFAPSRRSQGLHLDNIL